MARKRHVNEFLKTKFTNRGRIAGTGMDEEDYSENSFPCKTPWEDRKSRYWKAHNKIPSPSLIVTYKLSKEELEKYREEEGVKSCDD